MNGTEEHRFNSFGRSRKTCWPTSLDYALTLLEQATPLVEGSGHWPKGRFHLEFANTLKEIGIAENGEVYLRVPSDIIAMHYVILSKSEIIDIPQL